MRTKRRKVRFNHEKRNLFIFLLFVFFMGLGYSTLGANLGIGGTINIVGALKTVTLTGSNVSFPSDTVQVVIGGEKTFSVTPTAGYYLSSASCTNGYTLTVSTGVEQYDTQSVVVRNDSSAQNGTCTFAAERITARLLTYSNSNTMCATVQCALDELYGRIVGFPKPTNYIFDGTNPPTTSSPTTPPSGKNVYLGLYVDGEYGVCIKRNGIEHCFKANNWEIEYNHIQQVFSDIGCGDASSYVSCLASDFNCNVNSDGDVDCDDNSDYLHCQLNSNGEVDCY